MGSPWASVTPSRCPFAFTGKGNIFSTAPLAGGPKGRGRRIWLAVLLLTILLATVAVLPGGCAHTDSFDRRLNQVTAPYHFSILRWEIANILKVSQRPEASAGGMPTPEWERQIVLEYFGLTDQIRATEWEITAAAARGEHHSLDSRQEQLAGLLAQKQTLANKVEWILGKQVREAFSREGIYNPADRIARLPVPFPPLNFRLARPPHVLVVSPRERIESIREIMLVQDMDIEAMERLEQQVDALGVSSLVVEIGGFGATYPAFVADDASLRWTISTIAEEWLHQYLVFTPLGFMYLLDALGIRRDYDIATVNETVAGMVSDEIAAAVYGKYYQPLETVPPPPSSKVEGSAAPRFDFNREMRQIRLTVDDLLARGQVEEAERFMEERRQYLATQGYHIRKLNQAYFAFHGTYADEPTSVSPIGVELRELRERSSTLRAFLNRAAGMSSREALRGALEPRP